MWNPNKKQNVEIWFLRWVSLTFLNIICFPFLKKEPYPSCALTAHHTLGLHPYWMIPDFIFDQSQCWVPVQEIDLPVAKGNVSAVASLTSIQDTWELWLLIAVLSDQSCLPIVPTWIWLQPGVGPSASDYDACLTGDRCSSAVWDIVCCNNDCSN